MGFLRGTVVGMVMELSSQAAPGVEKAAEHAVESACHLADTAGFTDWNVAAAEDALDAVDTLAGALAELGPETAQALGAVTAATAHVRRIHGLAVSGVETPAPGVSTPRNGRQSPKRRGLGPGFQGIRTDC
ncbi:MULTISPECIES: hypothetical protein [unclassified Streptomyces]|uniref:hypothetical protein n=1 Tax=unclassified Streptomyces TaxID=2593676 RepID=UPI0036648530